MWKLNNISIKGIFVGIGFVVIASIIYSVATGIAFTILSGISLENQAEFEEAFNASLSVRIAFLLGGLCIAFVMGFIAEWFAKTASLINAAICGSAVTLFNIIVTLESPGSAPIWSQAIIILCVIPLAIAGGHLTGIIKKAPNQQ